MTEGQTPADPAPLLRRATELHGRGQLDAAETLYRKVLQEVPENFDALHLLGVLEAGRKNFPAAAELITRAIERSPKNPMARYNYGNLMRDMNRLEEARAAYDEALALSPGDAGILVNRGVVLFDLGRYLDALASYDAGLASKPNDAAAHFNRANVLVALDRGEEALLGFQFALRLRPQSPEFWAAYGKTLSKMKRQAEAMEAFKKATVIWEQLKQPDGSEPADLAKMQFLMGELFMTQGDIDRATKHFQTAIKLDPNNRTARYFLAAMTKEDTPDAPPSDYVATLFDDYAASFDKDLVGALGYRGHEIVCKAALEALGPRASRLNVVDLGCGTGLCGPLLRGASSRLVGIDLSEKMLRKARERGPYDELIQGDLAASLAGRDGEFDLAICTDVFVYFGNLDPAFKACARALKPGGLLAFTVEEHEGTGFLLDVTTRYRHSKSYLEAIAAASGFSVVHAENFVLRYNNGEPVAGLLMVLRRD